jgi:phosphoesterase RecJ-like protein
MKKNNCELKQIAQALLCAETILLFPHIHLDGDCLGSTVALCRVLRKLKKQVYILIEDEIPANLAFLQGDFCTNKLDIMKEVDICLAVDCSDLTRIEKRKDIFYSGKNTFNIDHHVTNEYFADFNYVDISAAATGEIIYQLIIYMKADIDPLIAEALYTAIVTDTGNFQYSNTTKRTHLIAAALFDSGMDHNKIIITIYQNVNPKKIKLTALALSTMEFICGGKGVIAYIDSKMFQQTNSSIYETDGVVEQLRNISGVEIATLLKEENKDLIKVGMRSKAKANVAEIVRAFGGGGHNKAAGCTIEGSTLEIAKKQIIEAMKAHLKSIEG